MRRLVSMLTGAAALAFPALASADALVALPPGAPTVAGLERTGHARAGRPTAIASPAALAALRERGLAPTVLVGDLAAQDLADRAADVAYGARVRSSPLPTGRTAYRHLADYEADLAKLAAEHPGLVKPLVLAPTSLAGRALRGVEITHDVGARDGKPVFLQLGLHHAREWPSGEHAIEFAFDLVRNDGKDPRITALLDRVRVIVVPVVNPDGFDASREAPIDPQDPVTTQGVGLVQNGTAYRRKNCRVQGTTGFAPPPAPCDAALGVDLNRNYGIFWGGNGASSFDEAPDFRGAGPFSEPESEAVRRLVTSRQVTMLITNHTSGDLVLRPPGVKSVGEVPDEPALKALGDRFAAQNGYVPQHSWELYDNSGTTEDFSYGVTGGFGYTFEIGPENFHPAYERAVVGEYLGTGAHAGKGNREAYLIAMEAAAASAGHAVLEGFAPPGRVLRVERTVRSETSPVCLTQPTGFFSTPCGPTGPPRTFQDELSSMRVVGADGVVSWHLNPSKAPLSQDDGAWRLTCATPAGEVLERRTVTLARGARVRVDLTCGAAPCRASRALQEAMTVAPSRGGRAVRIAGPLLPARAAKGAAVRVDVTRVAGDRRALPARRVLRLARLPRAGVRLPASRFAPGTYVVALSAASRAGGRDIRLRSFRVDAAGRAQRGPRFARAAGCRELRTARLAAPTFGGTTDRAAVLLLRLPAAATVRVTLLRRGRTVAMLAPRTVPGGRAVRLVLPGRELGRGAYAVRVTSTRGTAAARAVGRVTLGLRGL